MTKKYDDYMLVMEGSEMSKTDLDSYCEEKCYPNMTNFDILAWWKVNEGKYKVLSKMAMDILSIPITTVASESTFSAGGRVIDKKRSSMKRETVEVLLCAGDWIKEAYGLRTPKLDNDDPVELEFFGEFEMVDPQTAVPASSEPRVNARPPTVPNPTTTKKPGNNSINPPNKKQKTQKRTRKT